MDKLNQLSSDVKDFRKPEHAVHALFVNRWSPRAMSAEPISDEELMTLFEAARWAPSSYNEQPWMFLYAKRDTTQWDVFFNLLGDFNKEWCKNAAVLMVMLSHTVSSHNGKPFPTHAFASGCAWMSLSLEGSLRGLVVHGMAGFDYDKARSELHVPDDWHVNAMCVIGKRADKSVLPPAMQKIEIPSTRKPLKDIVREGRFDAGRDD